jgi:hypothetical protein
MNLNTAQLLALKAAIAAEVDLAFAADRTAGNTGAMAAFFNQPSAFWVWRPSTPSASIMEVITWASFTPLDAADGTAIYTNRALVCALKRDNLWAMLTQSGLNTAQLGVRNNLSDALQNVPAGAAGALLDAGWLGAGKVKAAISRLATKGENLFTTGTGTANTPGLLGVEGDVTNENVYTALATN